MLLSLGNDGINGLTDAPAAYATAVATNAMNRKAAVIFTAFWNFAGAIFSGGVIAKVVGNEVVHKEIIDMRTLMSALMAAAIWGLIAYKMRYGISKTYTLFSALAGSAYASGGLKALILSGWGDILKGVGIALLAGFCLTFIIVTLVKSVLWLVDRKREVGSQRGEKFLNWPNWKYAQWCSAAGVAFFHGKNDSQKYMGIMALATAIYYHQQKAELQWWMILSCASVMAFASYLGGWQIARRTKEDYKLEKPFTGTIIESVTALILWYATGHKIPQSTTMTVVSATAGAVAVEGEGEVPRKVVAVNVGMWIGTFFIPGIMALGIDPLLHWLF